MDTGLLWFDDDPQRTLEAKIGRAADRYREKYGRLPDTCYVNPQAVSLGVAGDGNGGQVGVLQVTVPLATPAAAADAPVERKAGRRAVEPLGARSTLKVISAPNMLRHHFWLGENGGP